ncbi:MAG: hypothetical protein HY704_10245 [Gemmatimonadetes bacterium]|nr:hypothetical protein [Gemmatimonadota bacterium]
MHGWEHRVLEGNEELRIQEEVRERNRDLMSECLADALEVMAEADYARPTLDQVLTLAAQRFEGSPTDVRLFSSAVDTRIPLLS